MSDYFVKTDSLLQASCELKVLSDRIKNISEEAKSAINIVSPMLTRSHISAGAIHSNISACSEDMLRLSDCLEKAVGQYAFSEENVKNKNYFHGSYAPVIAGVGAIYQVSTSNFVLSKAADLYKILKSAKNPGLGEKLKEYSDFGSSVLKGVKELNKDDDAALMSKVFNYFGALSGAVLSKPESTKNSVSKFLSLTESSGNVWSGMYNWLEKKSLPYDAAKLSQKFGSASRKVSIVGGIIGLVGDGMDTYDVFSAPESNTYDKAARILDLLGSAGDVGGKAYITSLSKTKALQFVNNSKANNQILADMQLKFTNSEAVTKKISKVNTGLIIGKVAVSTISSSIKRFGDVKTDGVVDAKDIGSIGVYGSLGGLDSVLNSATFGLVDMDSEKVAADLESDINTFIQGDSWAANYINDHDNPGVLRFGVSMGAGAYVLGENIIEGVVSGAKSVGSWISDGYNAVKNWIN